MELAILEEILTQLKATPNVSVVNTVVNGQDSQFTIYQVLPCSEDIYCVFVDPVTQTLYALQNTGCQFWMKWSDNINADKYFALPVTNYLIENREGCLSTFIKSCKQSDLGSIPIVREQFVNPFVPVEIINALLG